ncbi:hypothetical protein, partial [Stenotrophomonas sp. NRRL B-14846]|uniref:hypothetical protein n=1 Tax=Stenotrophomonas sp. NRRL B-14846 TaxID=3162882 RepID=UPI003D2654BF
MLDAAGAERLVELRLQAVHALVEVELAVAAAAVGAVLIGDLGGFTVLGIQLPMQAVAKPLSSASISWANDTRVRFCVSR